MSFQRWMGVAACVALGGLVPLQAATNEPLDFKEVLELLQANVPGATEESLQQKAALGLIQQLGSQASLVGEGVAMPGPTNGPALAGAAVMDGAYAYLRLREAGPQLDQQLTEAYEKLAATNKLKGVVVDLRFAGGEDYAAALAAANWFIASEQPLIDWGEGMKKSQAREKALNLPVAVLVNAHTSGAAEALAGMLRQADIGLILGTNTAGRASVYREFPLRSGQRLRLATIPVKMGDGKPLSLAGLKPDIEVDVSPEDEAAYYADAYKVLPRASRLVAGTSTNLVNLAVTNRPPRRRINEAELVRLAREGQNLDEDEPAARRESDPPRPVLLDPALARAIDLLKGLAVVRNFRTP